MLAFIASEKQRIEDAIRAALAAGAGTPDVGGSLGTAGFTSRILEYLAAS